MPIPNNTSKQPDVVNSVLQ